MIPVTYIGRRATYREGAYGSGVVWTQGETKAVPDDLAGKLLKHPDVYVLGEKPTDTVTLPAPEKEDAEERDQEVLDSIKRMEKDALAQFAKTHFNVDLDKRKGVEKLRSEVTVMYDRVGVE